MVLIPVQMVMTGIFIPVSVAMTGIPILSYQYSWLVFQSCISCHDWYLLSYPIRIHDRYVITVSGIMTSFSCHILSVFLNCTIFLYEYIRHQSVSYLHHFCISNNDWYFLSCIISTHVWYSCPILSGFMTGISLLYQESWLVSPVISYQYSWIVLYSCMCT